jgi:HTH-type transcriptional regulator, competence development regulator
MSGKAKRSQSQLDPAEAGPTGEPSKAGPLGQYLANIRKVRRLTLREVEQATGGAVSNAYLSQLENNKISRPSPNILNALARALVVPYETLMEKAGYEAPSEHDVPGLRSAAPAKKVKPSVFDETNLTGEEETALLEYLAFLRSRKGGIS